MALPTLSNFEANIKQLHRAAMILGPINNVVLPKQPNWTHLALDVLPFGLQSAKYPKGGQITLNFRDASLIYVRGEGDVVVFKLQEYTQKELFERVLNALQEDELDTFFEGLEGDSLGEKLIRKIHDKKPDGVDAALEEVTHGDNLGYDADFGQVYSEALYSVFTAVARWRARKSGHLSPVVVWPEHFDLSTLWFQSSDMDEYKAHINIGFAPYTEGHFERPYLYAYAYPYQTNHTMPTPAAPIQWESEAYNGIYVSYDALVTREHPELYIEQLCEKIFQILLHMLKAD